MTQPTLEDVRGLLAWTPSLGVLSVYLGFDPADRGGAWRTELRNGLDCALEAAKDAEHHRRVALRRTAQRLAERFEDGELRPPPRGEAGFVAVSEKPGPERWWAIGQPPAAASAWVQLADRPLVAPLVELASQGEPRGVALLSAERVRLLRFADGALEELADWELSVTSLDWRERKSSSTRNPARGHGIGSSGHDQYGERLQHNRRRFLGECGRLTARELEEQELGEVVVFGPAPDLESFNAGVPAASIRLELGGEADLISAPIGQLAAPVADAIDGLGAGRDRACVERALEEARGGARGASGLQETTQALSEGRVEHLVFDGGIGEPAEALVRGALGGGAAVTVVRDEAAELLATVEGVAAILRY